MTPEQKVTFITIAQMGMACGLTHPFEWLLNYTRSVDQFTPYEKVPQAIESAEEAFIAFLRNTGAGPDDPAESLDREGLSDLVTDYYDRARAETNVTLQQQDFEHLMRGGTLRINTHRGHVNVFLNDIGYVQMLDDVKAVISDGEIRVGQTRRAGE